MSKAVLTLFIKINFSGNNDTFSLYDRVNIAQNVDTEIEIGISPIPDQSFGSQVITKLITRELKIRFRELGKGTSDFKIKKHGNGSYQFSSVFKTIPPSEKTFFGQIEITLDKTKIVENFPLERKVYFPKFLGTGFPLGEAEYPSLEECASAIQNGIIFDGSRYFYKNYIYTFGIGEFSWKGSQPFFQCARVSVLDKDPQYYTNSQLLRK